MAEALLKIAAERKLQAGQAISAPDGVLRGVRGAFPYPETEDQLRVIEEVLEDLRPAGRWTGWSAVMSVRQDGGGLACGLHRGLSGDAGSGRGADDAAGAQHFRTFREAVRRAAGADRAALAVGRRQSESGS